MDKHTFIQLHVQPRGTRAAHRGGSCVVVVGRVVVTAIEAAFVDNVPFEDRECGRPHHQRLGGGHRRCCRRRRRRRRPSIVAGERHSRDRVQDVVVVFLERHAALETVGGLGSDGAVGIVAIGSTDMFNKKHRNESLRILKGKKQYVVKK